MTALERTAIPVPGPKFERIDGEVMFKFVIDGGSVIGPRPATKKDQETHVGAWQDFCALEGVSALDRDADGQDGGSLPAGDLPGFAPKVDPVNERDMLRKDLQMLGVEYDNRWRVPRLKAEVEKATAPKA